MSHITIAASENAFEQLFKMVRDNFTIPPSDPLSDNGNFGPFSASYTIALHFENGSIQLNNDGTIEIENLDVVFDVLQVEICLALPGIPGFCIIPNPWNGCLLGFPGIPGFSICFPLNLSGVVSEINEFKAKLNPKYFIDPGRLPAWSDLDAEYNSKPNMWKIFIDPVGIISIDLIDIPATVGNLVENAMKDAIKDTFPFVPGWFIDAIFSFLGPLLDQLKNILGFLDTVEDFLQDLLGLPAYFDLFSIIATMVADNFANKYPIYEFEDPYPILPQEGALIPVKIPLRDLTATVNTNEMIVRADVG